MQFTYCGKLSFTAEQLLLYDVFGKRLSPDQVKYITSCTAQIQMKDLITDKVYSQKVKGNEASMCEGVRVLKVQN